MYICYCRFVCICSCVGVFLFFPLGRVDGDVLASLAPPVHLSGEKLGWTLLVCMVGDWRRGHLEVSWSSASEGHISLLPYSIDTNRKHRGHRAVAAITVATRDWPSYKCSARHSRHKKITRRQHSTPSGRPAAHHDFTAPLKQNCGFYRLRNVSKHLFRSRRKDVQGR